MKFIIWMALIASTACSNEADTRLVSKVKVDRAFCENECDGPAVFKPGYYSYTYGDGTTALRIPNHAISFAWLRDVCTCVPLGSTVIIGDHK